MKKILVVISFLALALFVPQTVSAQEVCPQPYGGGVVCGAKTHEPVETGLAENLGLVGALALGASGLLLHFSKKAKQLA